MVLDLFGAIAFVGTWLGLLWFMIRFHITTDGDWRRTQEGRWFMYFNLAMWLILTWTGVRNFFEIPEDVRRAVGTTLFVGFGWFVWRQVALLEQTQRKARQGRRSS